MTFDAIDAFGRSQHGLVTSGQLLTTGIGWAAIRSWVESGRLVPVRRGVFRLAGAPLTQEQAWLAAVLGARVDAVLSHGSAAYAWRLRGYEPTDRIDLLSSEGRLRLHGVRPHMTAALPDRDRTVLHRIPITTAERTLVDSSGLLSERRVGRTLDDALRRKIIGLPRLVRCFEEAPLSGRRPSRVLRAALEERVPGFDPGGSDEELDVMRILKAAGIRPLPVQQYRIRIGANTYRVDYAWPETKHVMEYDSPAWHGDVSSFHDDRERMRRIQRAGWTVWPLSKRTTPREVIAIGVTATTAAPDGPSDASESASVSRAAS